MCPVGHCRESCPVCDRDHSDGSSVHVYIPWIESFVRWTLRSYCRSLNLLHRSNRPRPRRPHQQKCRPCRAERWPDTMESNRRFSRNRANRTLDMARRRSRRTICNYWSVWRNFDWSHRFAFDILWKCWNDVWSWNRDVSIDWDSMTTRRTLRMFVLHCTTRPVLALAMDESLAIERSIENPHWDIVRWSSVSSAVDPISQPLSNRHVDCDLLTWPMSWGRDERCVCVEEKLFFESMKKKSE